MHTLAGYIWMDASHDKQGRILSESQEYVGEGPGPVTLLQYVNTRIVKDHLWKESVISIAAGYWAVGLGQYV